MIETKVNILDFNEDYLTSLAKFCAENVQYMGLKEVEVDYVYAVEDRPIALFLRISDFSSISLLKIAHILRRLWNFREVTFLYVFSDLEIRVYNCTSPLRVRSENQIDEAVNALALISSSLKFAEQNPKLKEFERRTIDLGEFWSGEYSETLKRGNRVDRCLVSSMEKASRALAQKGLDLGIINALILRTLFVLFLEDKGAASEANLYEQFVPGATSFMSIMKDKEATYKLFRLLQKHFNGNITPFAAGEEEQVCVEHLDVVRRCFCTGEVNQEPLFGDEWRLFDFHYIRLELLSEIYENFLGSQKSRLGQFYTPCSLVDLVLDEKLPYYSTNYEERVLDITCGSGIFLVESYKRLIHRWRLAHKMEPSFEDLKEILLHDIFGLEIDETAIRVAAFGLYLTLINELNPKTLWVREDCKLPYLINDEKDPLCKAHPGCNLYRMNTLTEPIPDNVIGVDLIVGNPPFGGKNLPKEVRAYNERMKFNQECVLPFMHKATEVCPTGQIALICTAKVLFNGSQRAANFRKWLFGKMHVDKIYNFSVMRTMPQNYGGNLFADATCPIALIYYTALKKENDFISYYAPKTYLKFNASAAIVVDPTDVSYVPTKDCVYDAPYVLKAAMWSDEYAYHRLRQLCRYSLQRYFDEHSWVYGRGLNAESQRKVFTPDRLLNARSVRAYHTPQASLTSNTKAFRNPKKGLFDGPMVVFKQGRHDNAIVCSYFEQPVYFTTSSFAFCTQDKDDAKILTLYLNSRLAKYFILLLSSSWGIEREQVLMDEVLSLPSPFALLNENDRVKLVACYNRIVELMSEVMDHTGEIRTIECDVFNTFAAAFNLSQRDLDTIEGTLNDNLDLFEKSAKSKSILPVTTEELKTYSTVLSAQLMSHLDGSLKVMCYYPDMYSSLPITFVMAQYGESNGVEMISSDRMKVYLDEIGKRIFEEKGKSLFFLKEVRYYTQDTIYIIKTNQRRFWNKMQAYDDAVSVIGDILNMEGGAQ